MKSGGGQCYLRSDAQTPCIAKTSRLRIPIGVIMITLMAGHISAQVGWSIQVSLHELCQTPTTRCSVAEISCSNWPFGRRRLVTSGHHNEILSVATS